MNIIERLETVLAGGLESWPIASMEWEYTEAIKTFKQLTAENAKLRLLLDELLADDADGLKHLMGTDWIDRVNEALKETK